MTGKTINVDIKTDEKLLDRLEEHVKKTTFIPCAHRYAVSSLQIFKYCFVDCILMKNESEVGLKKQKILKLQMDQQLFKNNFLEQNFVFDNNSKYLLKH